MQRMWYPVQTPPLSNARLKGQAEMDLIQQSTVGSLPWVTCKEKKTFDHKSLTQSWQSKDPQDPLTVDNDPLEV